jgi:hypothetical protein
MTGRVSFDEGATPPFQEFATGRSRLVSSIEGQLHLGSLFPRTGKHFCLRRLVRQAVT